MSNEMDSGAAYLASLKRSASGEAAAPARATEAEGSSENRQEVNPPAPQRPSVIEKRRSPRYRCEGSARLQEMGAPTPVWATFTDISMHGCYVEAPNPFRVGAIVSLRLESGGFRVEATGEVRIAYPGVGMGISFKTISEADKAQLRELLQSLSPPATILNGRVVTRSLSVPPADSQAVSNPAAALQAIFAFFESRHIMGREEFLRLVRTSQEASK